MYLAATFSSVSAMCLKNISVPSPNPSPPLKSSFYAAQASCQVAAHDSYLSQHVPSSFLCCRMDWIVSAHLWNPSPNARLEPQEASGSTYCRLDYIRTLPGSSQRANWLPGKIEQILCLATIVFKLKAKLVADMQQSDFI